MRMANIGSMGLPIRGIGPSPSDRECSGLQKIDLEPAHVGDTGKPVLTFYQGHPSYPSRLERAERQTLRSRVR